MNDENKKPLESLLNVPQAPEASTGPSSHNEYDSPPALMSATPEPPAQSRGRVLGIFSSIFGALQFLIIGAIVLIFVWLSRLAESGTSGTEFLGLIVIIYGAPILGLIALTNFIVLIIYFARRRPSGKRLILPIISFIVAAGILLYGGYIAYYWFVAGPREEAQSSAKFDQEMKKQDEGYYSKEISSEELKQLLTDCKLSGLYYTNQNNTLDTQGGQWGEASTTGVVVTYIDNKPYRASIADRLIPEIVPFARDLQQKCNGPQFWHDNGYEQQLPDGTWQ